MTTPTVAFSGHGIDRADHLRSNPESLAALRAGGTALVLRMDGLLPETTADGALQWDTLPADAPGDHVFLGLRDSVPVYAPVPAQGDDAPPYAARDMFGLLATLGAQDLAIYGGARSLANWHARHRFCANCGNPTTLAKGGWQRNCPACDAMHFPRTDPVAIMLVEHEGDVLLGRQSRFAPRMYSALAGFVEPGETLEEAVAREVLEEAGVHCGEVRYVASQPWPFPSQLMIGCHAMATTRDITVDETELEDVRWFSRGEVAQAMQSGADSPGLVPPTPVAIAHTLLDWWLEQGG